ncbi:MAG: hypothetical protein HC802_07675 [Caldilineaceae bacterium]|nr:hypothetical protein [Caldilineaceae bacterium]
MTANFGLRFEDQPPRVISDPNRTDIACFIGFVGRRETALPPEIAVWLTERRWLTSPQTESNLLNLPTPIDTWEIFDRLFAWEQRLLATGGVQMPTYLGLAVRSFLHRAGASVTSCAWATPGPISTRAGIAVCV